MLIKDMKSTYQSLTLHIITLTYSKPFLTKYQTKGFKHITFQCLFVAANLNSINELEVAIND